MPKTDLISLSGRKVGQINLPGEIFGVKVNEDLVAQAVRVYLSNQRQARSRAKHRGEVTGSRRKIWQQKGLGRARHGDRYAPIFVGGGKAHGPAGNQNYRLKMTKKMKKKALFSALSAKLKEGQVLVVKDLGKVEPKTKKMVEVLKKISPLKEKNKNWKLTLVLPENVENVIRAGKNIKGVKIALAGLLNTYEVLNAGKIILMEESVAKLKETFLPKT